MIKYKKCWGRCGGREMWGKCQVSVEGGVKGVGERMEG